MLAGRAEPVAHLQPADRLEPAQPVDAEPAQRLDQGGIDAAVLDQRLDRRAARGTRAPPARVTDTGRPARARRVAASAGNRPGAAPMRAPGAASCSRISTAARPP